MNNKMVTNLVAWLATLVPFFALSFVFRSILMAKFYDEQLGGLSIPASQTNLVWLAVATGVISLGFVYFTTREKDGATNTTRNLINGAALAFVACAAVNFSNLANMTMWPTTLALVDIAWNTLVGAISAFCATFAFRKLGASSSINSSNDTQNFRRTG